MPIFFYYKVKTFWITNKSTRDVSLSDLNLTVKARTSVNLLDKRHHSYTLDQLVNSLTKGSLFLKKNMVVLRKFSPITNERQVIEIREDAVIPSRQRSIVENKPERFEELLVNESLLDDGDD